MKTRMSRMSTTMMKRRDENGSPLATLLSSSESSKRPRLRESGVGSRESLRESGYNSELESLGAVASPMLKRVEGDGNGGGNEGVCSGNGGAAVAVVEPMTSPAHLDALLKAAAIIAARPSSPIPIDLTSSPNAPNRGSQIVPPVVNHDDGDDDNDYDLDVEGLGESQEVLDDESLIGVQSQKHLLGKKY